MGLFNGIVRWLVVVVIGLATFWPSYGVLWLVIQWFPVAAIPVTIGGLFWVIILALALPFTLRQFRYITVTSVLVICAASLYLASTMNQNIVTSWPWFMWAVLILSFGAGWWKISTPLWRWANGIVAVQNTVNPEHHAQ